MRLIIPGKNERGDPELRQAIRAEIESAGGSITFARFMAQALQHPTRGYYRRGRRRAGHGGDFLTSPETHPAFAGALARQLEALGRTLGVREPLWIEAGAGVGTLSNDLAAASPSSASIVAVDTADHVHAGPPESPAPRRVRAEGLPFGTGSIVGGVFANELLDAFPVHRLVRRGAAWMERVVGFDAASDRFVWQEAAPEEAVARYAAEADRRGARPEEGQQVEVNLGAAAWIADAARVIDRGFIVLFDYGDDTPGLWGPRRAGGTLRCFSGHAVHEDPLVFVGTQDITAHVDFGGVVAAGAKAGLEPVAFLDQRTWLEDWGVLEAAAALEAHARSGHLRQDEAEINARAVEFLSDPRGLGAVRVLVMAKGISRTPIPGLTGPVPAQHRFTPKDLPRTRLLDPFADLY